MNCNDFEAKITDLARGRIIAAARDRALQHTADCRRCAARWRDEQRLTAGLRELAATFNEDGMPASREAQLLAAFRAGRRAAPVTTPSRRRLAWAAVAAAFIILVAVAAARFGPWRKPQPEADNTQATQPESNPAPVSAPPANDNAPTTPRRLSTPPAQAVTTFRQRRLVPSKTVSKTTDTPAIVTATSTETAITANPPTTVNDESASEIATAFIPLAERRGLAPADSLQLVRVELPRAALVSFGLPMNVERADQRIKADVLVGNDGVARAIRFVR